MQILDLTNELHAAAYLRAASHFLPVMPEGWDAKRIYNALNDEEGDDQKEIKLLDSMRDAAADEDTDPHLYTEEHIDILARDFLSFFGRK